MISIKQFREEPYGMFLDYENCPGGVAVNPETGNVYICDAPWHPATAGGLVGMIERADILSFQSQPTTTGVLKLELHCRFGETDQESVFQLGETTETARAQKWLHDANEIVVAQGLSAGSELKRSERGHRGSPVSLSMGKEKLLMLTPRQREILQLVVEGNSTKMISQKLGITVKTVDIHRQKVMEVLSMQDIGGQAGKMLDVGEALLNDSQRTSMPPSGMASGQ